MNKDKGLLRYHGMDQREHSVQLLQPFVEEVYLSCRSGQYQDEHQFSFIYDSEELIGDKNSKEIGGPMVGLLSAHLKFPDSAFFVLPIDTPFIDDEMISFLVKKRSVQSDATLIRCQKKVEPLIGIWETQGLRQLMAFFRQKKLSIMRNLNYLDASYLDINNPLKVFNVNSKSQLEKLQI